MTGVRRSWGLAAGLVALSALALAVPSTFGSFTASVTNTADTARTKDVFTCADVFAGVENMASAYFEWPLQSTSSSTTPDMSNANNAGTIVGGPVPWDSATPIACPRDQTPQALALNGSSQYVTAGAATSITTTAPLTISIWFKTTATSTGALVGLIGSQTGTSNTYDRVLAVTGSGLLSFYTYTNGAGVTTYSPSGKSYADGVWHLAVVTLSPTAGVTLYCDGAQVKSNPAVTSAELASNRYWRVGYSGNTYFSGSVKDAAAYQAVLSAGTIRSMYTIGAP